MKGTLAVTGLTLLLFGGILLAFLVSKKDLERLREEANLQRVVRTLSNLQQKNERLVSKMEEEAFSVVTSKFPWLKKNNTLPNYFLDGGTNSENYNEYRDANIAFLHYPRAAGHASVNCLREISHKKRIAMSPQMTSKNRILWETGNDSLGRFRNRLKMHSGRYVFGVCEKLNESCSYFLILRDPMQQAISSYNYCKDNYDDEMCHGFIANRMTLREWIINQGSVLFHQLMLNIDVCADDIHLNVTVPEEFLFNRKDMPCWLKQKIFLDDFSSDSVTYAVNYIISHLQEWFAVIGFSDEMKDTLEMFEKVYKLPFTKCKQFDKEEPISHSHKAGSGNSAKSGYQRLSDIYDENDPYLLSDDTYVREALSADYRIYKAALKLYHVQKQTLTNRIRW